MIIGVDIRVLMDEKYSGVSEYAANLLDAILKSSDSTGDEYRLFYNSSRDLSSRLDSWNRSNAKTFSFRYSNKLFNYLFQKTLSYPKIDKLIGGADIFFSPHFNFSSFSKGKGSPLKIITVHDLSFLRYPEFFNCRKNYWHKLLNVKKILRESNHIIAVSNSTKDDIVELVGIAPEKVSVIHSGLNLNAKEILNSVADSFFAKKMLGNILESGYILYLGTIEPRKNIENLIKAYNLLRDSNDNKIKPCKLILAGQKGWKHKDIFTTWRKSPYKDDIIFLGYVDEQEKEILYSRAKVFAYPSFYEGFGFPPLEAMAYGVPCVVSNVSSLPEVAGDAALMIDPNRPEEIAAAISEIISNEKIRVFLQEKGFKRIKEFSWDKAALEYIKLFKEIYHGKEENKK